MARARNIKPGLFKNEVLGVADPLYTLLFEGLWILADREGRLEDRPLRIKAEVFPYREADADAMLAWLHEQGFIQRYQVAGKRYILICEFTKHQNPHKNESESDIPPPEEIGKAPEVIGSTPADPLSTDSLNSDSVNRIPDPLSSVPKGTGGDAARPEDKTPEQMTKDELWSVGKSLLMAAGMPKAQCGSFVGKLATDYGNQVAVEAVRAAVIARPADPAEYMKACCMRSAGKRGDKPDGRRHDTPEETAKMLAASAKGTKTMPAEIRALTAHLTGRKAA